MTQHSTIQTAPPVQATRRQQRVALIALGGMALIWGYNWVVMKHVLEYVGPISFSAIRTMAGALVLFAVMLIMRTPLRVRAWRRVVLLGLLQTTMFSAVVQVALVRGGAGHTSILVYTMPFWVIPIAWISFGERVRGLQWLALALAVVGLVLVFEPWNLQADLVSSVLAVVGGLFWGLSVIVAKWIKRDEPVDALPLTAWQMLFGAVVLCVMAWIVPERDIVFSPYFIGAVLYNGFLSTALAWFLWLFALQYLSAGMTSMSALCVPVVSVLAGWLQLGERPGGYELSGMLVIALALAVLGLRAMHEHN